MHPPRLSGYSPERIHCNILKVNLTERSKHKGLLSLGFEMKGSCGLYNQNLKDWLHVCSASSKLATRRHRTLAGLADESSNRLEL
jgi:hypothetical protein